MQVSLTSYEASHSRWDQVNLAALPFALAQESLVDQILSGVHKVCHIYRIKSDANKGVFSLDGCEYARHSTAEFFAVGGALLIRKWVK